MVKLYLFNNVRREEVGQITLGEILNSDDITEALYRKFYELGCISRPGRGRLLIKQDKKLIPFDERKMLADNVTIVYYDIIALNNAYEFCRENGIIYFFHTSEKGHLNMPHIHAKYSDDEISIYFNDYRIVGKMKSKAKMRLAKTFVKEHINELYAEWNRII